MRVQFACDLVMGRGHRFTFCVVVIVYVISVEVLDGKTVASTNQTETQKGSTEQICQTPNGDDGKCININSCKSLKYIFEYGPQPFSETLVDQLKSYICGFEGPVFKVCCPSEYFYLDDADSVPIDVSKHRNIELLNQDCGRSAFFANPWIALLSYRTNSGLAFKCQGTILNDRYILTAAQCASETLPLIGVRVGERNLSTTINCQPTETNKSVCVTHQDLRIEKVILHDRYNKVLFENDIGLLKVQKMNIADNVKPICLPTGNLTADNLMNKLLTLTGFGVNQTGKLLKLPLVPLNECRKVYKKNAPITKNQICAGGENGKGTCGGDGGGPLQYFTGDGPSGRYVQYGILSFGRKNCSVEGWPSVYTKVEKYMKWILDHMDQ